MHRPHRIRTSLIHSPTINHHKHNTIPKHETNLKIPSSTKLRTKLSNRSRIPTHPHNRSNSRRLNSSTNHLTSLTSPTTPHRHTNHRNNNPHKHNSSNSHTTSQNSLKPTSIKRIIKVKPTTSHLPSPIPILSQLCHTIINNKRPQRHHQSSQHTIPNQLNIHNTITLYNRLLRPKTTPKHITINRNKQTNKPRLRMPTMSIRTKILSSIHSTTTSPRTRKGPPPPRNNTTNTQNTKVVRLKGCTNPILTT